MFHKLIVWLTFPSFWVDYDKRVQVYNYMMGANSLALFDHMIWYEYHFPLPSIISNHKHTYNGNNNNNRKTTTTTATITTTATWVMYSLENLVFGREVCLLEHEMGSHWSIMRMYTQIYRDGYYRRSQLET